MELRKNDPVGRGDSVPPRFTKRFGSTTDTKPEEQIAKELTNPEQWLKAAQTGKVNKKCDNVK